MLIVQRFCHLVGDMAFGCMSVGGMFVGGAHRGMFVGGAPHFTADVKEVPARHAHNATISCRGYAARDRGLS